MREPARTYARLSSLSADFLWFVRTDVLGRNEERMVLTIIRERGKTKMSQRYSREYNAETERPSDTWSEETYSIEDRAPLPWEGRGPISPGAGSPHKLVAGGFAQTFGLHPAMAFLTVVADTMIFGGDIASAGLLLPVAAVGAVILGIITFMAQKAWYQDGSESAFIKALIVALLTAIPSPLPYFLFVPAGLVGLFRTKR
jgi:hypothetical protein